MKVLHFITNLETGGAETFLGNLIIHTKDIVEHEVISLKQRGPAAKRIEAHGIRVHALGLTFSNNPGLTEIFNTIGFLLKDSPDIVHSWLYHSDLLGGIYGKYYLKIPVIWSIRRLSPVEEVHLSTLPITKLCSYLSHYIPDKIVANSKISIEKHVIAGYEQSRTIYIPNGFNLSILRPDETKKVTMRNKWKIPKHAFLIGMVSRFLLSRDKDYPLLLKAFNEFKKKHNDAYLVLVGPGNHKKNPGWNRMFKTLNLSHLIDTSVFGVGPEYDISGVMNALDVMTLASKNEGFPNVIGEAMACEIPVIATDVFDVEEVMGSRDWVVPVGDVNALIEKWEMLYSMEDEERKKIGKQNRNHIKENFDINNIVMRYVDLYKSLTKS